MLGIKYEFLGALRILDTEQPRLLDSSIALIIARLKD